MLLGQRNVLCDCHLAVALGFLDHEQGVTDVLLRPDASLGEQAVAFLKCGTLEADWIVAYTVQLPLQCIWLLMKVQPQEASMTILLLHG